MTHVARVTVGVPAYNEASYLEAQLEYLRTQDFPDIEVLIYDNASTDATREIARRFCEIAPHDLEQADMRCLRPIAECVNRMNEAVVPST